MANQTFQNRDRSPISREQIARFAPSVLAEGAHDSRSSRYLYVPTVAMLDALGGEGFEPVFVSQSRSRDESKRGFTRHMVRLAHRDQALAKVGDSRLEIVLTNSHDGSSAVILGAGMYRLVCSNGLIVGKAAEEVHVRHSAKYADEIIEGTYRVLESATGEAAAQVEAMARRELAPAETLLLAQHASSLRWPDGDAPVQPAALLARRRGADRQQDAWTTLNVLQENAIRGGLAYRLGEGRAAQYRHTREVTGIDQLARVNRGIWDAVATLATADRATLAREAMARLSPEERAALLATLN